MTRRAVMRPWRWILLINALALPAFGAFSVDLPIVSRSVGSTSTSYTSIDITNNASQPTDVSFEYLSSDGVIDVFGTLVSNLPGRGNFHQEDLLQYLSS